MDVQVSVTIDGDEVYRLLPGDKVIMPASAATQDIVLAAIAEALSSITGHRSDFEIEDAPAAPDKRRDHLKVVSNDG